MPRPLISIIIPTYNRTHLIGETLDSIIAQTYTNWECLVVDDGSTDNTDEVLRGYIQKDPRFKYFHRPDIHKPGGNGARNYGFLQSKGEYVNWFDSDDLMHCEKLEKQVKALHGSDYNFVVCQSLMFESQKDNVLGLRHNKVDSENPLEDFIMQKMKFFTPSPLFRKSFLEKYDLSFDEELKASQEWEFFCRILFYSPRYKVDETPLVLLRKHSDRISSGKARSNVRNWNYYLARKKIYNFLSNQGYDFSHVNLYFTRFFVLSFKWRLRHKDLDGAHSIFNEWISNLLNRKQKIKIIFAIYLYIHFGRGYNLISNELEKYVE